MKRIMAWMAGVIVAIAIAAAASAGSAQGDQKIKITVPATSTTFAPLYHAKAAGYFTEEGLNVEIVVIPGTPSFQAAITGTPSSQWFRARIN